MRTRPLVVACCGNLMTDHLLRLAVPPPLSIGDLNKNIPNTLAGSHNLCITLFGVGRWWWGEGGSLMNVEHPHHHQGPAAVLRSMWPAGRLVMKTSNWSSPAAGGVKTKVDEEKRPVVIYDEGTSHCRLPSVQSLPSWLDGSFICNSKQKQNNKKPSAGPELFFDLFPDGPREKMIGPSPKWISSEMKRKEKKKNASQSFHRQVGSWRAAIEFPAWSRSSAFECQWICSAGPMNFHWNFIQRETIKSSGRLFFFLSASIGIWSDWPSHRGIIQRPIKRLSI